MTGGSQYLYLSRRGTCISTSCTQWSSSNTATFQEAHQHGQEQLTHKNLVTQLPSNQAQATKIMLAFQQWWPPNCEQHLEGN